MKTHLFSMDRTSNPGISKATRPSGRTRNSGFVAKAVVVALSLGALSAAGFALHVHGKSLTERFLPAAPQGAIAPSPEGLPQTQVETVEPGEIPPTSPSPDLTSLPTPSPAPAKAVAPAAPKVAPAGMLYLAKRITITKESGMASFPKGTLVIVKSRAGGKISASIRGMTLELTETEAVSVLLE